MKMINLNTIKTFGNQIILIFLSIIVFNISINFLNSNQTECAKAETIIELLIASFPDLNEITETNTGSSQSPTEEYQFEENLYFTEEKKLIFMQDGSILPVPSNSIFPKNIYTEILLPPPLA